LPSGSKRVIYGLFFAQNVDLFIPNIVKYIMHA